MSDTKDLRATVAIESFLIVDCGGGTLTTCKFMLADSLGEDTERTYADKEFIKLLKRSAGMKQ
ncbi:hypothetical protein Glove_463g10 [Diversispora epigaea]|uniref:Uncharacterized protein n=1 Tax=Diversispora epigaea TaxID=1348612 RepID=A0A397GMH8_9GLOM|nr:hypothetical protein Glove_463g10 [Diversispora epigaea]